MGSYMGFFSDLKKKTVDFFTGPDSLYYHLKCSFMEATTGAEKLARTNHRKIAVFRIASFLITAAIIGVIAAVLGTVTLGPGAAVVPFIIKPIAAFVSSHVAAAIGLSVATAAVVQEVAAPALTGRPGLFMRLREKYNLWRIRKTIPQAPNKPCKWDTGSLTSSNDNDDRQSSASDDSRNSGPLMHTDPALRLPDTSSVTSVDDYHSRPSNTTSTILTGTVRTDSGIGGSPTTPPHARGGSTYVPNPAAGHGPDVFHDMQPADVATGVPGLGQSV